MLSTTRGISLFFPRSSYSPAALKRKPIVAKGGETRKNKSAAERNTAKTESITNGKLMNKKQNRRLSL